MVIKVAMIGDLPEPGAGIDGGVQAVTRCLVDALIDFSDIELHVLSFKHGVDTCSVIEERGHVRYLIPFSGFGTATLFVKDQSALNSQLAVIRPDVVHSQGCGHHAILAGRSGYPTVVTVHGIATREADFQSRFRKRLRTRIQAWYGEYHGIRRGSHTILISPYVAEHYGSALSGERYFIPNPVDPRFFDVTRRETPGRILFAGRIYSLKGIKDLLEAIARTTRRNGTELVLAGSLADTRYVSELKDVACRLGLADQVRFRGILGMEELLEEFARCSCLVLPSYQETAPMVIQEAMASGLPVIASNVGGIPYQVDDGKSGYLFSPGKIDELAERLDAVLSDGKLREQFSEAAKLRAENEYRAEAVARSTVDVYRDMLR